MYYLAVTLIIWLVFGFISGIYIVTDEKFDEKFKEAFDESGLDRFMEAKRPKLFSLAAVTLCGLFSFWWVMKSKLSKNS